MKLTTKQLKQIIKEELNFILETDESMASSEEIEKVENMLYNEDDLESILQGLSIAEVFQIPVDYQKILINKTEQQLKDMTKSSAVSQVPELLHHVAKVATLFSTLVSIANNPMALPKTLVMMGDFEGVNLANVVARVAKNPNTPMETLIKLSKHKSWFVRSGIAQRDDVPEDIIKDLLGDRQPVVKRYARETLNRKKELMEMAYDPYGDPGMRRRRPSIKDKLKGNQGTIDNAYVEQLADVLTGMQDRRMSFYTSGMMRHYDIDLGRHEYEPTMSFRVKIATNQLGSSNPIKALLVVYRRSTGSIGYQIPIPLSGNPEADGELINRLKDKDPEEIEEILEDGGEDWIESTMPGFPERYM